MLYEQEIFLNKNIIYNWLCGTNGNGKNIDINFVATQNKCASMIRFNKTVISMSTEDYNW